MIGMGGVKIEDVWYGVEVFNGVIWYEILFEVMD